MEASWGRGAYVALSLDAANALVEPLGFRAGEIRLIEQGHANTNYLVALEGGQAVLRLYQRDPRVAALERAISERLSEAIPVPKVLAFDDDKGFSLIEWMPGETLEALIAAGRLDEVVAAAPSIGRALAVVSSIKFDAAGFLGDDLRVKESWPSVAEGLFGYLDYLLDQDVVRARAGEEIVSGVRRVVAEHRERLAAVTQVPCLSHGDYKASNLLIQDGCLSGVLDWEFAHSGTWLLDAGQLFRHPLPAGFLRGFEAGFVEGMPLDWRELSRVVDLLSLVDFLNRPDSGDVRVRECLALIVASI